MPKMVRILTLGVEGGRIDVLGRLASGVWRYRVIVHDQAAMFLDEGDLPTTTTTRWFETWRQAVQALDRNRWYYLSPIAIDHRFRRQIRASLRHRLPETQTREWGNWSRAFQRAEEQKP